MSREIPVRNQIGKIIGLRPQEDVDPVQATLDTSLKAVGATPTPETTLTPATQPETPERPSWRAMATAIAVLSTGILVIVLFSSRTPAPSRPSAILQVPATALPTPQPPTLPSIVPTQNPREVTLSPITLYGDYAEHTKIGAAPAALNCTLTGQSPDGTWAYLSCPMPTNDVWAKVVDLELTAMQHDTLMNTPVISRSVPTVPAFSSPSTPQGTGPSLVFCAQRDSIWGRTHQCAATQAAADALADGELGRINATAEAQCRSSDKSCLCQEKAIAKEQSPTKMSMKLLC